jgi:hypothetical protein
MEEKKIQTALDHSLNHSHVKTILLVSQEGYVRNENF